MKHEILLSPQARAQFHDLSAYDRAKIRDAIDRSDVFLFLITPHSVESAFAAAELGAALACNKRIIGVVAQAVPEDAIPGPVRDRILVGHLSEGTAGSDGGAAQASEESIAETIAQALAALGGDT